VTSEDRIAMPFLLFLCLRKKIQKKWNDDEEKKIKKNENTFCDIYLYQYHRVFRFELITDNNNRWTSLLHASAKLASVMLSQSLRLSVWRLHTNVRVQI